MKKPLRDIRETLIGDYYLKSPYHKRKKLPFSVKAVYPQGEHTSVAYPLEISTVEFKGNVEIPVNTAYAVKTVAGMINRGLLKKVVTGNSLRDEVKEAISEILFDQIEELKDKDHSGYGLAADIADAVFEVMRIPSKEQDEPNRKSSK